MSTSNDKPLARTASDSLTSSESAAGAAHFDAVVHTPGPWEACNGGKCSCLMVWSKPADHPVCTVESGEWGDTYPALRVIGGGPIRSIGAAFEPYIEKLPYGSIDRRVAEKNARLIAAAPNLLHACKEVQRIDRTGMTSDEIIAVMELVDEAVRDSEGR